MNASFELFGFFSTVLEQQKKTNFKRQLRGTSIENKTYDCIGGDGGGGGGSTLVPVDFDLNLDSNCC